MVDSQDEVPPSFTGAGRPSVARVYNALLGGKDNFQVDRDVRDRLLAAAPGMGRLCWDVREFSGRVTRFLARDAKVDQFLDCGPGMPNTENTHEVAQRVNREASVVYAATDPVVLAHGRALLEENDRTHFAEADFRDADQVLQHETVRKYIDFGRPVAVYHIGTVQYASDARDPGAIIAQYVDALPSGSYVVLAHFVEEHDNPVIRPLLEAFADTPVSLGHFRSAERILSFLDGLELLEPGLVIVSEWWPDGPRIRPLDPAQRLAVGALARKP
ncbi:SAM-dependent methyltransferase [Kibdelosporangium banguiense]|uniref:SAM-dependent methyltransferase n=1 Tax=Kibdelosporangium banguiense TaxID=1365924 RepID=A0ABS4TNF3_9PSEU|nr:SAM-dependent methyltransferase [Kibdelosporangium banguiense]MBP2325938.1 SAM-dependent methyltransferase [Kibdelosporangium banguiense]